MANVCMDTVVFFAAQDKQRKGFRRLKQAVADCYTAGAAVHSGSTGNGRSGLYTWNGLATRGSGRRGFTKIRRIASIMTAAIIPCPLKTDAA